jgi:hypothetical protein
MKSDNQGSQNCVLSKMSECATYFESNDAIESCATTPDSLELACTAINVPRVYTTVYKHPSMFQSIVTRTEPLIVTSHKLGWCVTYKLSDVQPYLNWIQFSNLVNQKYMIARNANFQYCLGGVDEEALDSCNDRDNEFTLVDDISKCVSQTYSELFDTQVGYYQRLLNSLTITPGSNYNLKTGCILPVSEKFNQVNVNMTPINIPRSSIKAIVLQNHQLNNITCQGDCMNAASPTINMPGTNICSIFLEVRTDQRTQHTFSVEFDILVQDQILFSGLFVFKKKYAATNYYFCSNTQFVDSGSYITDNVEYDKLQQFVSGGMCMGKDYYIQ